MLLSVGSKALNTRKLLAFNATASGNKCAGLI